VWPTTSDSSKSESSVSPVTPDIDSRSVRRCCGVRSAPPAPSLAPELVARCLVCSAPVARFTAFCCSEDVGASQLIVLAPLDSEHGDRGEDGPAFAASLLPSCRSCGSEDDEEVSFSTASRGSCTAFLGESCKGSLCGGSSPALAVALPFGLHTNLLAALGLLAGFVAGPKLDSFALWRLEAEAEPPPPPPPTGTPPSSVSSLGVLESTRPSPALGLGQSLPASALSGAFWVTSNLAMLSATAPGSARTLSECLERSGSVADPVRNAAAAEVRTGPGLCSGGREDGKAASVTALAERLGVALAFAFGGR